MPSGCSFLFYEEWIQLIRLRYGDDDGSTIDKQSEKHNCCYCLHRGTYLIYFSSLVKFVDEFD